MLATASTRHVDAYQHQPRTKSNPLANEFDFQISLERGDSAYLKSKRQESHEHLLGGRKFLVERQSMKILHHVTVKLVMIAIACSFAASTTAQADDPSARAATGDTARLVVSRSADFGTEQSVHLFVDGVEVTDIGYNTDYDGTLSPGEHVLAISTTPNPYGDKTTQQHVNARPGQTYAFTAVWNDPEHASLEPSPEG